MLTVLKLDEHELWDSTVRSFKNYDVYWLSGYVKAFKIHGDGEPLLFFYEDENTRGINVVMKRDVADDKRFRGIIETGCFFDFSTPYGYGGWIIEGEVSEKVFDVYYEWLRENKIVSEFVRFHPILQNHKECTAFYDVIQLGEVVHMDLDSRETIWNNITSKNRNMIRKAIKNDVKIYNGRYPEIFEKFRIIYNGTMTKDDANEYYFFEKQFYESILEDLSDNAQVFWAEKDGEVIAASIMLGCNKRMNYHLSGSLQQYSSLAATNLLLYRAAVWGNANGYKTLYLGGGVGSGEDGLFRFKRAFNRTEELSHFYIGKKIYDVDCYQKLTMLRNNSVENTGFFPLYRG